MADDVIAGRYGLRELLGAGPMSEVWAADDAELGRRVALKLLAPDADRARFDREARAAAALAHPNITQLYDYGEAEGRPYMVLEHLPGGTLEDRLGGGRALPDEETRRVATEVAAGLAHAHSRGVVHRDLKPANILFDGEGRAKIADFGIARLGAGGGTLTEAGTVLGTAAYISPEQAVGDAATPASDVYSFGVILYRMLAGRLPFEAEQPMALLQLHRDAQPPPLELVRHDAPADLAALAIAALAKNPTRRPADGSELAAALGAEPHPTVAPAATGETQVLPATTLPATAPPPRRRLPLGAAATVLILLAAGGAALAYVVTRPATPAPAPTPPTTAAHRKLPELTASSSTHGATTGAPPPTTTPSTTEGSTTTPSTTAPTTTRSRPPPTTTETFDTTTAAPPTTTAAPPPTTQPAVSVTVGTTTIGG